MLNNWEIDDTSIPPMHYNSLCYFDYEKDYEKALNYRNADKPFIVYNTPAINSAVEKWSDTDYLVSKLGSTKYRSETSDSNHFMYFNHKPNAEKKYKDSYGTPLKVRNLIIIFGH